MKNPAAVGVRDREEGLLSQELSNLWLAVAAAAYAKKMTQFVR
jgi:hypothetical protein